MKSTSKLFNNLLLIYVALYAIIVILLYADIHGVYSEGWEARFRSLASSTGNSFDPDYGLWGMVIFSTVLIIMPLSLIGLYKRYKWAKYLFTSITVYGLILEIFVLGTIDYTDSFVSVTEHLMWMVEGCILVMMWRFSSDVGFTSNSSKNLMLKSLGNN